MYALVVVMVGMIVVVGVFCFHHYCNVIIIIVIPVIVVSCPYHPPHFDADENIGVVDCSGGCCCCCESHFQARSNVSAAGAKQCACNSSMPILLSTKTLLHQEEEKDEMKEENAGVGDCICICVGTYLLL